VTMDGKKNPANQSAILVHLRHELRTPLNAIIGYCEMLLDDAVGSEWHGLVSELERLREAGKRLLHLVTEILAPSSFNAPQATIDLEAFAAEVREKLRGPLDDVLLCTEGLIRAAEEQGHENLIADLQNIRTAGRNLLGFIDEVPWSASKKPDPGANSARSTAGSYRPVNKPSESGSETESSLPEVELGSLLVVDDNEMNRDILSRCLMKRGHAIATAKSGREALAILKSHNFDLVLLDIMMPDMNGYEVVHHLKADKSWRDIPVIFISAIDDTSRKVEAFKSGGVDYVTKPFQAEEVLARVENQLKIARLQKALELQNEKLVKKNEDLIRAQKRTEIVFSALADVLPGTVLDGKYRLEDKIGSGGFGAVYRATHIGLNKLVAVKIFRPTAGNDLPEGLKRFRLEGISASRITHPNAVAVLDSGISGAGMAYLVMELLQGHTLAEELEENNKLPPARSLEILIPVCDALAEAHDMGIVHRDVKPENIFLHQTKHGEVVKVVDFGIAKLLDPASSPANRVMTISGSVVGTPAYIAPERLADKPYNGQADVYSLGIVAYQMLSGRVPFQPSEGGSWAMGIMHLTKEPAPLREIDPDIPPALESIVMKTLLKDPNSRPTARELAKQARDLGDINDAGVER
jgi:CheY-like chemotaxis protein